MDTQTAQNGMVQEAASLGAPVDSPAAVSKRRRRWIRVPVKWFMVGGAGVGILGALALCLASNYLTVLVRQARDGYVMYRLASERDELRATKVRLEKELVEIRKSHSDVSAFEASVRGRLAEIDSVVEASTALGVFKRDRRRLGATRTLIARNGATDTQQKGAEGGAMRGSELAALLDSPVLTGRARRPGRRNAQLDEVREKNRGLGGAEVSCRKDSTGRVVCASSVAKEDVAYTDMRASIRPRALQPIPDTPALFSESQRELIEQVEHYAATLRALPMGSPVAGEITSGFGYRHSPFSGRSTRHEGVDISLERGTKIRAPGDGIVVKAEYDGAYGWVVDLAHAGTVITRYAHLSRAVVKVGQQVRRGQVIALSGSTGRSTGPHLHYEVRVNGLARNPMPFIALASKLDKTLS
jgi:hypothetical protein